MRKRTKPVNSARSESALKQIIAGTATPRFFICDAGVKCSGGHNVELANVLVDAAQQKGFLPVLLAHLQFQNDGSFPDSLVIRPTFRFDSMPKWSMNLDGRSKVARDKTGRIALRPSARVLFYAAMEQFKGRPAAIALQTWAHDFSQWCQEYQPNGQDRILLSTACDFTLLALVSALSMYSTSERLKIDLLFHFSLRKGREGECCKAERSRLNEFKSQVCSSLEALDSHDVRMLATTHELTRQLNAAVGSELWSQIDYPIRSQAEQDSTVSREKTIASDTEVAKKRDRILIAGSIRPEKGKHQFAQLINQLQASALFSRNWQLAFQFPKRHWNRLLPKSLWPRVAEFRERQDLELFLNDGVLDRNAYSAWIRSATVGLLLYDGQRYFARCSGILLDMFAVGIPVIVPAGSWLSRALRPEIDRHVDRAWEHSAIDCPLDQLRIDKKSKGAFELDLTEGVSSVLLSFRDSPDYGDHIKLTTRCESKFDNRRFDIAEYSLEHRAVGEPRVIVTVPSGTMKIVFQYRYLIRSDKAITVPRVRIAIGTDALPESAVGLVATTPAQVPRLLEEFDRHREHYQLTAKMNSHETVSRHSGRRFIERLLEAQRPLPDQFPCLGNNGLDFVAPIAA